MTALLVVRREDVFSRILTENGFSVLNCPTIETAKSEKLHALPAKISAARYDGIFLTSRKAAAIVVEEIFCQNFIYPGKIYVLGKSSFDELKGKNLDLFYNEEANTAREMLEAIPPGDLKNKRFLFIRGDRSLGTIRDLLENIATLDEEIVYETRFVRVESELKREIEAKAAKGEIAATCFFSPSGAESFLEQFGTEVLHQTKLVTIGKTTAEFLEKRNLRADFIAAKATAEDYASQLMDYLKSSRLRVPGSRSDSLF